MMRSAATISSSLRALLLGALLSAPAAMAAGPNPQCVEEARNANLTCKAACREDFLSAKDSCRNVDHDCADACRAGRAVCVGGPLDDLESCLDGCNETLEGAKQTCRSQHPEGSPERDQCIDEAQLAAFQCRDTCREGVIDALRQCRISFRACIIACPPPAN